MKNKKVINIVIIAVVALVIVGIWIYKNNTGNKNSGHSIDDGHGHTLEELGLGEKENWQELDVDSVDLEKLKENKLPIMIDFGSDTCAPCVGMRPVLEEIHAELMGKVTIVYADVDKITSVSPQFPIEVVPTQYFFDKDGNPFVPSNAETMSMILYQSKQDKKHVYTAHQGSMTKSELLAVFNEMGVSIDSDVNKEKNEGKND